MRLALVVVVGGILSVPCWFLFFMMCRAMWLRVFG